MEREKSKRKEGRDEMYQVPNSPEEGQFWAVGPEVTANKVIIMALKFHPKCDVDSADWDDDSQA